jgi:hypothetical protein
VSHNRIVFSGLDELFASLRALPDHLRAEAGALAERAAGDAAQNIRARYQAHRFSGDLAEHVTVTTVTAGRFGVRVRVKSAAFHAYLFEIGTETVRLFNGASRGKMPPGNVFIPEMMRARRKWYAALRNLVASTGLKVSGDA